MLCNFKINFTVSAIMAEWYWHMDHWKRMENPKETFDLTDQNKGNQSNVIQKTKTIPCIKTMVLSRVRWR